MEYPVNPSALRLATPKSEQSSDIGLRYPRDVTDRPSGGGDVASSATSGNGSGGRTESITEWLENTNRKPHVVEAIRRARLALPGDPAFGDPLSTAGPGSARAVARAADRIVGDEPGAAREIRLGALQVWQAALERVGRGKGTQEVTIVFTDLVAFSSWSLGVGDEATLELLRAVAKAIEPPIVERSGHVVKRMGDGLMAVFSSPDRAVQAVVAARHNLENVEVAGFSPQMRVGIHTGTPREIGGDWLGVDVTIASRVMEAGGNGNTMLSASTLQALHHDTLEQLGLSVKPYRRSFFAAPLNGVPEDLRIFGLKEN
ncbi:adenylate/guanylate cyclase domain-containing protein [Antrihabitans cavernicola]|uniref:Adenylate/guanylate cyclase domain-containing protein n=1 Tax=Antrihabitans cavernicola TaxID=2495913 RepID=A0A5A7S7J6_9NOCA|nr:adenylate/guanylate cyclase domain-containing protein [Spelaeibacter cavernicola]